jgi:hypothetical protein
MFFDLPDLFLLVILLGFSIQWNRDQGIKFGNPEFLLL